jgi:endonuclease/exonuclease/phosphatase family metal-dependent hydrolase
VVDLSLQWDAGCIRLVTCGVFKHRHTKQKVVVLNTHLDNSGAISRQHSAKIILGIVDEMLKAQSPVTLLLTGDFNSPPDDEAYQIMTASDSSMQDTGETIPKEKRHGNEMTFTSFGYVDNTPSRIDFIFSAKETNFRLGAYAVLSNRFDDGIYLSDHRAVVVDLEVFSQ